MKWTDKKILAILDDCADSVDIPMLDNLYWEIAATQLTLYRSDEDWAVVFETFFYSDRVKIPSLSIDTIASRLHNRKTAEDYVNERAHQDYLANNPHNDSHWVEPIEGDDWVALDDDECYTDYINPTHLHYQLRGKKMPFPTRDVYHKHGLTLDGDKDKVHTATFARLLAVLHRDLVMATEAERRYHVPEGLTQALQLREWYHPNISHEEMPSHTETFQQLAQVLITGDREQYTPTRPPNTHWSHWADA